MLPPLQPSLTAAVSLLCSSDVRRERCMMVVLHTGRRTARGAATLNRDSPACDTGASQRRRHATQIADAARWCILKPELTASDVGSRRSPLAPEIPL
jgi:hypothetical protein